MWHVRRIGEMHVGFQYFDLTGRQFGRAKVRWENKKIMLQPATLVRTQNVVKQMAL